MQNAPTVAFQEIQSTIHIVYVWHFAAFFAFWANELCSFYAGNPLHRGDHPIAQGGSGKMRIGESGD